MASSLGITVGALSSVRNYTDDAKVADTLLKFYTARSLGPLGVSNQEKLDAVIAWIQDTIVSSARQYELNERRRALEDEVTGEVGLE